MNPPAAPLSAVDSDPLHQRWMQGAPPAPHRLVSAADMSHFRFPSSRWAFANMRQLLPTTQIWRGCGPCRVLPDATSPALDAAIDAVTFVPIGGDAAMTTMSWRESLDANYTDAIAVLHRGRIVYERYFGVMAPQRVHMAMSVTKSYTGTMAAMLVHAGELDETKPVAFFRRVTGRGYGELLSEWFWQPLGCEEDACMLVDSEGTEFAGGGLNATLRDMARFGEAMRLAGEGEGFNGKTIVPPAVVNDVRTKGSADAFKASGPPTLPGGAYRNMWWVLNNAHGAYAARCIHGQAIVIDPTAQVVIARFGSHPLAANVHLDPASLPAFDAVAKWLMANA